MRPYPGGRRYRFVHRVVCVSLLVTAVVWPAVAQEKPANGNAASGPFETHTRAGFVHYYDLDYEAAVASFERALKLRPDDPAAVNHLLSAVLLRELYRVGALDTGLYSNNSFLDRKKVSFDPKVRERVNQLMARALQLAEQRLKADPNDVQALYARGATRGMRALCIGMVDRAWFSALRSAVGAKKDHERVLEIDARFHDAKTVVGVHNYVAGSLPWAVKIAVSLVGLSGNKKKGLQFLQEAAAANGETAIDARIALSLFLRREQRFSDALAVARELLATHPRNFLFALEEANVLNDMGRGPEAIAAYRRVLEQGAAGFYPDPHLELAAYGLGEALRGQRAHAEAAEAYERVRSFPNADRELLQRADLGAGQMYDVLRKREAALQHYSAVIATDDDTPHAALARKHLKVPFQQP